MNSNNYFKLYASCIPVKGFSRSLISDLQNGNVHFIPNDFFEILTNHNDKKINCIKAQFNYEFNDIIDENFNFLVEKELGFFTNAPELYPKLSNDWFYPFEISNAIVDLLEFKEESFKKMILRFDNVNCKFIQLRFFKRVSKKDLTQLIKVINNDSSIVSSFQVLINNDFFDIENLKKLILSCPKLVSLLVFNFEANNIIDLSDNNSMLVTLKSDNKNELTCGIINQNYFSINTKTFTESLNHNTCLNRKISIDKDGNIKNCPSMPQSFGNIKDTTLEEALNHPDFKKYWNINKDQIEVCKDCEFRHICTDCRAYTERSHFDGEIDLSKPLKCGYNPYTSKWSEWSTNPLKQKAIEYYGMQELVKKEDLNP